MQIVTWQTHTHTLPKQVPYWCSGVKVYNIEIKASLMKAFNFLIQNQAFLCFVFNLQ